MIRTSTEFDEEMFAFNKEQNRFLRRLGLTPESLAKLEQILNFEPLAYSKNRFGRIGERFDNVTKQKGHGSEKA